MFKRFKELRDPLKILIMVGDTWLNTINFCMCHLVGVSRVTLGIDRDVGVSSGRSPTRGGPGD